MLTEPTPLVAEFMIEHAGPGVYVSGDWIGRPEGKSAVIVDFDGGYRVVRDRMDRAEFVIHVYAATREAASALAFRLRDAALSSLPAHVAHGVQVADAEELMMPTPTPDELSRESRYTFAFAIYLFETTA
ncbi:hypothetical protein [Yinghuangia sp. YIM S09857]|uniref:hypothetical protein n=1 Tax=Yinghuangia sp. YIM S09857 TaxID=3436929 RepID=UPI003F5362D5